MTSQIKKKLKNQTWKQQSPSHEGSAAISLFWKWTSCERTRPCAVTRGWRGKRGARPRNRENNARHSQLQLWAPCSTHGWGGPWSSLASPQNLSYPRETPRPECTRGPCTAAFPENGSDGGCRLTAGLSTVPSSDHPAAGRAVSAWEENTGSRTNGVSTYFYLWKLFTVRFHCRLFYRCSLSSYLHPLPIKQGEVDVGLDRMNRLALGTWFFSKGASTSVCDAGTVVLGDSAPHCPSCEVSASLSLVLTPQGDREGCWITMDAPQEQDVRSSIPAGGIIF